MSDRKLVRFSLAALLAALAAPSMSSALDAAAPAKAGVKSDASAAGTASDRGACETGVANPRISGEAASAPAGLTGVATVRERPGAAVDGRLVVLDATEGTFAIEGKNGLFRAPQGTDLAGIGGKKVRVHANAHGDVSSIEVRRSNASFDARSMEPAEN